VSEQLTFPGMPEPSRFPAPRKESADRRRTRRQKDAAANGAHPLSVALTGYLGIHPDADLQGRKCGNCRFRELINRGARAYPKCTVPRGPFSQTLAYPDAPPRFSAGSGTDVRRWWPGCPDHEFGDNMVSPDAARSGPAAAYIAE